MGQLSALTEAANDGPGGLEPEVDAAARRMKRLLRAKLEELKAVPLRGGGPNGRQQTRASESSSGERRPIWDQGWGQGQARVVVRVETWFADLIVVKSHYLSAPESFKPPGLRLMRFGLSAMPDVATAILPAGASSPQGSSASFGLAAMTIDDYEIIKPISRGAFGRVYLVRFEQHRRL